jgi:hypothetical protein
VRRIAFVEIGCYPFEAPEGAEIYWLDDVPDEDEIDLRLLDDLHSPMLLAFIGDEEAKRLADLYGGKWISGSEGKDELVRFWNDGK